MALDWKQAYMIGIRDGVRLAQAQTVRKAKDIGADIGAAIVDADLRTVRVDLTRWQAIDGGGETERDPGTRLKGSRTRAAGCERMTPPANGP